MKIIRSIAKMQEVSGRKKLLGKTIGFVPTMGALHEGHLSLISKARKENNIVVVSIFVNPAQFSPKEDFKKYPRNIKKDAGLCRKEGVDFIFYPEANLIYPPGFNTCIEVCDLSNVLCGKFRPGHFKAVATIVAKLFNIIRPDVAYFGQKDAQQSVIIKKMVSDLNIPVRIKVLPTVREPSGLAMSSRNLYLDAKQRKAAAVLNAALNKARALIRSGKTDYQGIINKMEDLFKQKGVTRIDYISIVDFDTLKAVRKGAKKVLIALAVWVGSTRLIDNLIVNKGVH